MSDQWYKDALIYQIHVRSFFDANDDGYGDFQGLRQRLPYLEELGVNTLWLLPFYQSPLKDDGYDIADYYQILPVHGTLDDFRAFLDEAHARNMRVITELVLNHTSDQHPWFQEARQPGSPKRDWYVWSDTPDKYPEVRIIFTDTEHSNWQWDPVAGAYYWHRFFSHQPDLNWDNPEVERAMHEVMFYWLDMGVDGLRLDAVPYLYEREGTNGENLPETIDAVRRLRRALDERYGGEKILLAEANQWPEDTLPYFGEGSGDGVQMAFNFPIMPRLYLALRRENRRPIVEMLRLTQEIPEGAQWALFLRNHDELTLEMVTDEERDYLYHEYAADRQYRLNLGIRRRLAPLLGGNRRRIELMTALLLSLPGSPVIYYGDELGMGDNVFLGDRNGVRTPMQWSADRNAGFSRAPFHQLFLPVITEGRYSYEFVNVEEEHRNPSSQYHFVRRLIAIRNRHAAVFGRGEMIILETDNPSIFAFIRSYAEEDILVVANLSRFAQAVTVPLGDHVGHYPVELFGRAPFPRIEEAGYRFTVGPHAFYWFTLVGSVPGAEALPAPAAAEPAERDLPTLRLHGGLETLLVDTMVQGPAREQLERLLPGFLAAQHWFGFSEEEVVRAELADAVRLQAAPPTYLTLVRVFLRDGGTEWYALPLGLTAGPDAARWRRDHPGVCIAALELPEESGVLHDAAVDPDFWRVLYQAAQRGWRGRSLRGLYTATPLPGATLPEAGEVRVTAAYQSNSSAVLEGGAFIKLYRRLSLGVNPEAELLEYLTAAGFPFVPRLRAELRLQRDPTVTIGIFQEPLVGPEDGWSYAQRGFGHYLDRVPPGSVPNVQRPAGREESVPALLEESAPEMLELSRRLGVRTGELHAALGRAEAPWLAPQPASSEGLVAFVARLRSDAAATQRQLEGIGKPLPEALLADALEQLDSLGWAQADWQLIRIHGDYHLGQVVAAEGEYYVVDFEGEPDRTSRDRRAQDHALRDVAGLLRSFDYAGGAAWRAYLRSPSDPDLASWTELLVDWCQEAFLQAYLATTGAAPFLPTDPAVRDRLLWALQFDKVLYEVRYELGHRPDWVDLPLHGARRLLGVTL